jgi:nitrous oxide reductase
MNLNEFNIETRINGQNINEVRRHDKEERLNEVMKNMRQEIQNKKETQNLNETVNFKDVDYVTLEMFEKARFNSMMQVANRILPK